MLPVLLLIAAPESFSQRLWQSIGPDGGDARALVADPASADHLYLGTTSGWVYESKDRGGSWQRLARLEASKQLILDHIVVDAADSSTLYAAAWRLDQPGGGLWISHDQGHSWSEAAGLHGQSIRAFAQAHSNPEILLAGTLEGVFRSSDAGASWSAISPPNSREIHEVESLAIDPADPNILYAGTWHLPWKTTDGGKSWHSIKNGVIDDSDVFSIIVDPQRPRTVFISACSGIYKSGNGGELFHKIQGIPSSARRTRVLRQDPHDSKILYAGTTEGLYKSVDGGSSFERLTGPEVIVNDVLVDAERPEHLLLATDRGGVLSSQNAGRSFVAANRGFSGRKVEALLVDRLHPGQIYAGVVSDKQSGGVYVSGNNGQEWRQIAQGLDGRDVFALAQAADGTILAGTSHGIFAWSADAAAQQWVPRSTIANTRASTVTETHFGTRVNLEKQVKDATRALESRVVALDLSTSVWLAATSGGLYTSRDQAASWQGGPVMGSSDYSSVAVLGNRMVAARMDGVVQSTDAGHTWAPLRIPQMLTRIHCVSISADGTLWLGGREGIYLTRDSGQSWLWMERLPFRDGDDLSYDANQNRILASSRSSQMVYSIDPGKLSWKWAETGYRIARIRANGPALVAASLDDGVLVEPAQSK